MASAKTLYVCRPLLNGDALHEWAANQGFTSALPADDLHVTIAFSREPFDWSDLTKKRGDLETQGGRRSIEKLGDAIVLRFSSNALANRWRELQDAGASWDYPGYKPHITITYEGAPDSLDGIEPYRGPLSFGSERFSEVDEDANKGIAETPMATTTTNPNNAAVRFRGQAEREMPPYPKPVSQAQNAAMHAAAEGESTLGIPKKVGQEFAKGAHGTKVKRLPKHVRKTAKKLAKGGMISERAMKKHMGGAY